MLTGKQIGSFLLLILKKIAMSLLVLGILFVGFFLWALTIYPFNFPYLLHLPADETNAITGSLFSLIFLCVVTVTVRTKWCYDNDLFFAKEEKGLLSLFRRIVTSRDFVADVIVFALYVLAICIIAIPTNVVWLAWILTTLLLMVIGSPVFGLFNCLLYVLARKRADKLLRKRKPAEF